MMKRAAVISEALLNTVHPFFQALLMYCYIEGGTRSVLMPVILSWFSSYIMSCFMPLGSGPLLHDHASTLQLRKFSKHLCLIGVILVWERSRQNISSPLSTRT